jgi:disulfide bond formation protein DsbB
MINKIILFLASLLALGGGMIAGRQIYLQHLPADQIPTCAPPLDFLIDTLPFMELIQTILLGDGNCAEYQWRFIFNFAEWALLFFVILFFYNLYFLLSGLKR